MSEQVIWILEMQVNEGKLDSLKSLMAEMSTATEANEPGTVAYEWSLSVDESTCHLYERYADSAAAMVHIATFGERYAARFLEHLTPTRVVLYGEPDQAVQEALAAFGAIRMLPAEGFAR